MSDIIIIESNPLSSSGICYTTGGPVTFSVVSGVTGIDVAYYWYLNDVLVSIGSGYTLSSSTNNDQIHEIGRASCRERV